MNIHPLGWNLTFEKLREPFLENAIWHGLMPKPSRGKVFIRIFQSQQQVSVMVEDNGVRRKEKPESENSFSTSQGILLTDRRLKLLYPGSKIIIEDLKTPEGNPSGTKVTLKLSIS